MEDGENQSRFGVIGKVRRKSDGAELEVIRRDVQPYYNLFHYHAEVGEIASSFDEFERMAGFVIVAWGDKAKTASAVFCPEDSLIGITMVPSYVADALRRHINDDDIKAGGWSK